MIRSDIEIIDTLVRIEVKLAELTRGWADRILSAAPDGAADSTIWSDYGFKWPAYTLAHLYCFEHPDNPLAGRQWCADLAMKLVDKAVDDWHFRRDRGAGIASGEVPHYVAASVHDWLGALLDDRRRAEWTAYAEAYAELALGRPFGFTANYHDVWRMLSLYRMGQVHRKPAWSEMALWLMQRMVDRQTAGGFWEEGRHHGPSMRYNGLMLPVLAWFYRLTGDERCGEAAAKLAAFMGTYTYPDAITVGPFDGRNSPMLAFFPNCPGLELAPEGRALAARGFGLWRDLGSPENVFGAVESTRDAVRLAFYAADTCAYLSEHVPAGERQSAVDESAPLPIDADRTLEHHSAKLDGLLHRRGPWVLALSGQNSDIPRYAVSVYRLERESRIELWHKRARLVIGGGHSLMGAEVPYANVMLDTGHAGPVDFGRLRREPMPDLSTDHASPRAGGAIHDWRGQPADELRAPLRLFRGYYMPRQVRVEVVDAAPVLTLAFAHGIVRFRTGFVDGDRVEIDADWDIRHVQRLCLQLPLVVWRSAAVSVDGKAFTSGTTAARDVDGEVRVEGGPFRSRVSLTIPDGVPGRVYHPMLAQPTFSNFFDDDPFRPQFGLAMVSCQWTDPPPAGGATFTVTVEA